MSQKNYTKLYFTIFFTNLRKINPTKIQKLKNHKTSSLEVANAYKLNNTGRLFKYLAFIGLAYSNVILKDYRILTTKSIIMSLWNMIAAHINIF